uniref:Transposase n=1 Tax=Parastrongyloides trichosuri TaxID=131310 RepID=A0A0N4Z8D8_PARTI
MRWTPRDLSAVIADRAAARGPRDAVRPEHLRLADPDRLASELSRYAFSGQALQVRRSRDRRLPQALPSVPRDGFRQRVVAQAFHGDCGGQEIAFMRSAHGNNVSDAWAAFGQGAGLVKGDGVERAEVLKRRAALDQNAGPGRTCNPGQDGARRGDGQGAGAGGDQHGHGPVEAVAERLVDDDPGEQQDEGQGQHERDEDPLEPVGEPLRRRLLRWCRSIAGRLDLDGAGAVDGACEDDGRRSDLGGLGACRSQVCDRLLVHRHALAGDRGLIDAGRPHDHEAVGRQALVRAHHDDIADLQVLDRKLHDLFAATHAGGAGRQVGKRLDGALGPPHGVVLQGVAEAEQEQKQRAFGPGAERRRARGRDQHEGVDLEALAAKVLDRLANGEEAAEPVGGDEQTERHPRRDAGRQLLYGETQPQQTAASQGEDQLRIGPKQAAVGMVMLLALHMGVLMGAFLPGGMRRRRGFRRRIRSPQTLGLNEAIDFRPARQPPIELQMEGAGHIHRRLDNPVLLRKSVLNGSGVACMAQPRQPA